MCYSTFTSAQNLDPYLQSVTPTSIYVSWKTDSNTETIVEYGIEENNLNTTVTGNTNAFTDSGYTGNYLYHNAKLINLSPNTKYYYKIKTGSLESETFSFKTLPNPGEAATEDGHIRFLIMGDNQLTASRYDSLVSAAHRKIKQKWGTNLDPEDNVALTFMVGDQVDIGNLNQYENIHFKKNTKLSSNLPIHTTVGNHETYGSLGMEAYYDHFYLDGYTYQGISSGTENYYAMQAGNVLFISLSSEHTSSQQLSWLQQIVSAANTDSTVDWIISLSHRPYQAEQYVGDISPWVRNSAVPLLTSSSKFILHIGAHHHLYHRGQLKDSPAYNIISGGTAWDQYWGMATEQDFEDVQKTINNWMYQIIDIDVENGTMDVESYSIGSIYKWKNNQLMDEFHRYKNTATPNQPIIENEFTAEETLPLTIAGSDYQTSTNELLNTSQFLISKTADFNVIEKEVYRDYENLFGMFETQSDSTVDINLGLNIKVMTIAENEIPNGDYHVKVRYRDRNLEWSSWSESKLFTITGSSFANTSITLDAETYDVNNTITIQYADAPQSTSTWIGLYLDTQTPSGSSPSQTWSYTDGTANGSLTFTLPNSSRYYAAIFENGGYTEIADRQYFYVGAVPELITDAEEYSIDDTINISFTNGPQLTNDWIGIYKMGQTAGENTSASFQYVSSSTENMSFTGIPKGYYFAEYYIQDSYNAIGNKVFFKVGDIVTELWINKPVYDLGEDIVATWTDAPGIVKDWLGIYPENTDPNVDPLISYTYFDGLADGTIGVTSPELPTDEGNYFLVMFTNDSYNEVSNRVDFQVVEQTLGTDEYSIDEGIQLYPNPASSNKPSVISSKYPIDKIDIYNTTGQLVYSTKNVNNNKYSLITQDLPTGVYILKIHSRKVYTTKLIVK
ncbi:hypothetical protein GCM10010976_32490 [Bizionia arctica]|uniref:T9SS type A sorting domain-containing protein n=2 Tax=Bizionia arctica TaxID=1495645 RepID=A0A917LUR7_9FLAO|nr:hypothetical protein GCM10010976_32490 [Bizionia arctica]